MDQAITIQWISGEKQGRLRVPYELFQKNTYDVNGAVVGIDHVDGYLRNLHHIWCEDWWPVSGAI